MQGGVQVDVSAAPSFGFASLGGGECAGRVCKTVLCVTPCVRAHTSVHVAGGEHTAFPQVCISREVGALAACPLAHARRDRAVRGVGVCVRGSGLAVLSRVCSAVCICTARRGGKRVRGASLRLSIRGEVCVCGEAACPQGRRPPVGVRGGCGRGAGARGGAGSASAALCRGVRAELIAGSPALLTSGFCGHMGYVLEFKRAYSPRAGAEAAGGCMG